ncbi:MAG: hypothetical protein AB2A00_03195 [Myxococcota bacterium]
MRTGTLRLWWRLRVAVDVDSSVMGAVRPWEAIMARVTLAAVVLMAAVGCSSTQLVSSWSDPTAEDLRFQKVLVVALTGDAATRRIAEDQAAQSLHVGRAIPAYRVVSDEELRDLDALRRRVAQEGFDAVMLMRVVGVDYVPQYSPATPGFVDYFGYVYPMSPVDTEMHVRIETTVFSLPDDKLIWAGLTHSVDPSSVENMAHRIAEVVRRDMRRRGLLD